MSAIKLRQIYMYKIFDVRCLVLTIIFLSVGGFHKTPQLNSSIWQLPGEECMRTCEDGDPPRYCYFHFTVEQYETMGLACNQCKPDSTEQPRNGSKCQCIEADGIGRSVISVNRMLPGPSIQVCLNDRLIVDVENRLLGQSTSIHWHGIFLNKYQYSDGVPFVTQCPIYSKTAYRYYFAVEQAGTYFYHSHDALQKFEGLYGSLVIRVPPSMNPHYSLYDEDLPPHVIIISDWRHDLSLESFPIYKPNIKSFLFNGRGRYKDPSTGELSDSKYATFDVEYGKRYRFRLINAFSSVCPLSFFIDDHTLLIIAEDGKDIEPVEVNEIRFWSGERIDFVLTANRDVKSYWITASSEHICRTYGLRQNAILKYDNAPSPIPTEDSNLQNLTRRLVLDRLNVLEFLESTNKVSSYAKLKNLYEYDPKIYQVVPDFRYLMAAEYFQYLGDNHPFIPNTFRRFLSTSVDILTGMMGNISHIDPHEPLILDGFDDNAFCNITHLPENCTEPCVCTHVINIAKGAVVEIILYDPRVRSMLHHTFHLHGHNFVVFTTGMVPLTKSNAIDIQKFVDLHDKNLREGNYHKPLSKDTFTIAEKNYIVIRFIANNPGWWLFHCHYPVHAVVGMKMIIHVGEKEDLPPVPEGFPRCTSRTS